jgi:hypothetical protein
VRRAHARGLVARVQHIDSGGGSHYPPGQAQRPGPVALHSGPLSEGGAGHEIDVTLAIAPEIELPRLVVAGGELGNLPAWPKFLRARRRARVREWAWGGQGEVVAWQAGENLDRARRHVRGRVERRGGRRVAHARGRGRGRWQVGHAPRELECSAKTFKRLTRSVPYGN